MGNSLHKFQLISRDKTKKSGQCQVHKCLFHVQSITATTEVYEVESMVLKNWYTMVISYVGDTKCQVRNNVSIHLAESTSHDLTVAGNQV